MEEQHIYLHALRCLPSMGDKGLRRILLFFDNNAKEAWESSSAPDALKLGPVLRQVWMERHTLIPDVEENTVLLAKQRIRIITENESDYPPLLKEIPDRPYFLYVRGKLPSVGMPLLAVVGSRRFSNYGKQVCSSLVRDLSRAGIGIVSGLAFGIDKIAHVSTLENDGVTWAVLGSGIDDNGITPTTHQKLGREIIEKGALISEFPPGCTPSAKNFPLRNRIVAGMTLGTLVIEAAEKSGSLITARLALEYNREVFAVPGSIFSSLSQGTNALLKNGAIPVTNAQDILRTLVPQVGANELEKKKSDNLENLSESEKRITKLLSYESLHIDEIVKQSGLSIVDVSSTLMLLEMKKITKHIGNQQYILFSH